MRQCKWYRTKYLCQWYLCDELPGCPVQRGLYIIPKKKWRLSINYVAVDLTWMCVVNHVCTLNLFDPARCSTAEHQAHMWFIFMILHRYLQANSPFLPNLEKGNGVKCFDMTNQRLDRLLYMRHMQLYNEYLKIASWVDYRVPRGIISGRKT